MLISNGLLATGIAVLLLFLPGTAHASTGELFFAVPHAAFTLLVFALCFSIYSINWCLDKFGRGLTRVLAIVVAVILSLFLSYMAALLTVIEWWGGIEYYGHVLRLAPILIAIRWIIQSRIAGRKWLRNISKGILGLTFCWVVLYSFMTIGRFVRGMDFTKDFEWVSFIPGLFLVWWLLIGDFRLFLLQRADVGQEDARGLP